jgi:calmodulin
LLPWLHDFKFNKKKKRLNDNQLKELRECFELFDSDKSGHISSSEFKNVLQALDIKVSDVELKNLIKSIDKDNSGEIDFEEFSACMAKQFYRKPS